jgi:hypothetical protein
LEYGFCFVPRSFFSALIDYDTHLHQWIDTPHSFTCLYYLGFPFVGRLLVGYTAASCRIYQDALLLVSPYVGHTRALNWVFVSLHLGRICLGFVWN